jgi:broad specificity phosphatase PhoE
MLRLALVRPGSTTFDDEGRIKGCLDIPLSPNGEQQARRMAGELAEQLRRLQPPESLAAVYSGPCQSAQATAAIIAEQCGRKQRVIAVLGNIDHGLWQGRLIEEVKRLQPRLFRQIQDAAESFSPPGGETLEAATARIRKAIAKLVRKHRNDTIVLVVPDPLASLVKQLLVGGEFQDLWKSETDSCGCEWIQVESHQLSLV